MGIFKRGLLVRGHRKLSRKAIALGVSATFLAQAACGLNDNSAPVAGGTTTTTSAAASGTNTAPGADNATGAGAGQGAASLLAHTATAPFATEPRLGVLNQANKVAVH